MNRFVKNWRLSKLLALQPVTIIVIAFSYAFVADLSFWIKLPPGNFSPIFPSAGIAIAGVILYKKPALAGVFLGSLLYNVVFANRILLDLIKIVSIGLGVTLGAGIGASLVQRFCKKEDPLSSVKNILILVFVGAICSSMISPTIGILSLTITGQIPWDQYGNSWLIWWVGDAAGVIVAAPVILAWIKKDLVQINFLQFAEALLLLVITLVMCYFIFFHRIPMDYCITLVLVYAAFRFGMRGTSTMALAVTIMAAIGASAKTGLYSNESLSFTLIHLHVFLSVSIISSLILAGILYERKQALETLQLVKTHYQNLVENSPDVIARFDTNLQYLFVNEAIRKVSKIEPQNFKGKTLYEVGFLPSQAQQRESILREAVEKGIPKETELESTTIQGLHFYEFRVFPEFDNSGNVQSVVTVNRDITERKLAERIIKEKSGELERQNEEYLQLNEELIQTNKELLVAKDIAEQSEARMRISEDKFNKIFQYSPAAITLTNLQSGLIVDFNQSAEQLFGYSRDVINNKSLLDLGIWQHPTDRSRMISTVLTEKFARLELDMFRKSGDPITTDASVSLIEIGGQAHLIVINYDITQRKKAESELLERNQFIESLINLTPDILYIYDLIDRINVFRNEGIQKILGYSNQQIEQMGNRLMPLLMHPDDLQMYIKNVVPTYRSVNDHEKMIHQYRIIDISGNWHWIESTEIIYERELDGSPRQIFAVGRDITEQKLADEFLRNSENKFRLLYESANDSILMIKEDKFIDVNTKTLEIFGCSREQILNQTPYYFSPEFQPDGLSSKDKALIYIHLAFEGIPQRFEWLHTRYDQSTFDADVSLNCLEINNEKVLQAIVRDITERKQAEYEIKKLNLELELRVTRRTAQLEAANKDLEAFSYSVSHDLRAPVRHISGFTELLGNKYASLLPGQARHYISVISTAAQQMGDLIDDLLQFSRTGKADMLISHVNMKQLVIETREFLLLEYPGRKIYWNLTDLPPIQGDLAMMRLVWINLLSNALKYSRTREITEISIWFKEEAHQVIYYLKDNGVGFDMKHADKLFGVFQRLHSTEEFEGSGIGLANVRRIITRHGGWILAEAEPDQGATFYFGIPI